MEEVEKQVDQEEGGITREDLQRVSDYLYRVPESDDVTNKIRALSIREVNRGYIVDVGCHTFAISTKDELIDLITRYINEPLKVEEKWFKGELF